MDKELIDIANKFADSVEKAATATAKIGKAVDKLMVKFDEEMATQEKRRGKYFAKSGDTFKLSTDITIPAKEKDVDPDKRPDDEVIKAGAIVTVNVIIRHGDLVYQLVHNEPLIIVSGYELKEMLECGILEEA